VFSRTISVTAAVRTVEDPAIAASVPLTYLTARDQGLALFFFGDDDDFRMPSRSRELATGCPLPTSKVDALFDVRAAEAFLGMQAAMGSTPDAKVSGLAQGRRDALGRSPRRPADTFQQPPPATLPTAL
jgi:hypothetical protein